MMRVSSVVRHAGRSLYILCHLYQLYIYSCCIHFKILDLPTTTHAKFDATRCYNGDKFPIRGEFREREASNLSHRVVAHTPQYDFYSGSAFSTEALLTPKVNRKGRCDG